MSNVVTVRLNDEVNKSLNLMAESMRLTKQMLVTEAIRQYIVEHQKYIEAIQESILEVEQGMAMSHNEVKLYWKKYFENVDAH